MLCILIGTCFFAYFIRYVLIAMHIFITFCILNMLSGLCVCLFCVCLDCTYSAVSTLLADGDRVRMERDLKVEQAQQFCLFKRLPKDLSHAIITHTKYHCKNNFLFDEHSVLNNLPTYLKFSRMFVYMFLFLLVLI